MTYQPVQAIFFWRADSTAAFKAVYGRLEGRGYTKDFHQPIGLQARALERAFGLEPGEETEVIWRWPGGEHTNGKLHPAADYAENGRLNLRWPTDQAPPPWRLHPSPNQHTIETLRGVPGSKDLDVADAQLEGLRASNEKPWFLAVHLRDEGPVLHTRLVLENPQPGREFASWESLPSTVRAAMQRLPSNRSGGVVEFEEDATCPLNPVVDRLLRALRDNPNVLLVGPPGTGKTVALETLRAQFESRTRVEVLFDPDVLHGAFTEEEFDVAEDARVRAVVFHPSFSYEDFVIGLLPEPAGAGGGVTVRPHVGPLLELAHFAGQPGHRALLLCDEFNRGPAAAIFGDTIALLDRDKRATPGEPNSGASIATPYHHLSPRTTDGEPLSAQTSLPDSLYIVGAMNSADRSVAPLDAALRRRFSIVRVDPDPDLLAEHLGAAESFNPADPSTWVDSPSIRALAVELLRSLNSRIEAVLGRDFLLGHSVFWHVEGEDLDDTLLSLAAAFDNQVMGSLLMSFPDDDISLAAVLNIPKIESGDHPPDAAAVWHYPPEAVQHVANPRLRPLRLQELGSDQLKRVFASLI